MILPGLVNAHSHLEYAVYAGFGDGLPFVDWLASTSSASGGSTSTTWSRSRRLGAAECLASGMTTVGDASFSGAAALAATSSACARSSTSRSSAARSELAGALRAQPRAHRAGALRPRPPRHLPARPVHGVAPSCTAHASSSACPSSPTSPRAEPEREWLVDGSGAWSALRGFLEPPPGATGDPLARGRGLLCPASSPPRTASRSTPRRSRCSHGTTSRSCTARARTRCSAAASRRSRSSVAPGVRVGLGTDSPASAPSFDMFEEMRAAVTLVPGTRRWTRRRSRPRRRARAGDARLGTGARPRGRDRLAAAREARRPHDRRSRTASAFAPVEDPAVAVRSRWHAGSACAVPSWRRDALRTRRFRMARASAKRGRRPRPNARTQPAEPDAELTGGAEPESDQTAKPSSSGTGVKPVRKGSRVVRRDQSAPQPAETAKRRRSVRTAGRISSSSDRLRRHMKWVFLPSSRWPSRSASSSSASAPGAVGSATCSDDLFGRNDPAQLQSVQEAKKRVAESPNDPEALLALASAYRATGQPRLQAETLERVVVIRPDDGLALTQLGRAWFTAGDSTTQQAGEVAQLRTTPSPPTSARSRVLGPHRGHLRRSRSTGDVVGDEPARPGAPRRGERACTDGRRTPSRSSRSPCPTSRARGLPRERGPRGRRFGRAARRLRGVPEAIPGRPERRRRSRRSSIS